MPWSSSLSDLPRIYFISSLVRLCSLAHSPQMSLTCALCLGCYQILLPYKITDNIMSYNEYCYIVVLFLSFVFVYLYCICALLFVFVRWLFLLLATLLWTSHVNKELKWIIITEHVMNLYSLKLITKT
jgi:hypothetical protein